MRLHKDAELFRQTILRTAQKMQISEGIVEKDYYVTLFLKEVTQDVPDIIFKGGTSLAKCYRAIRRFSEDLDLSIICGEKHPTEGSRKKLSKAICAVGQRHGMILKNEEEIKNRRDFNRYDFDYHATYEIAAIKSVLIVETALAIRSFPFETKDADSLVTQFLQGEGRDELIETYDLKAFPVWVQTRERTFADKIFALADYYLAGKTKEHSRHLYDLYKLLPEINLDDAFQNLFREVREARKPSPVCPSAQDGCDIKKVLREIADEDIYKKDYQDITRDLLYDDVSYDEAKTVLHSVIEGIK